MKDIQLIKYIQGSCSEEEKKEVIDWIEESDQNFKHYIIIREIWDAIILTSNYSNVDTEDAYLKIKKKIAEDTESEKPKKRFNIYKLIYRTAVAALVFIALYPFIKEVVWGNEMQFTTLNTPIGSKVEIVLPDSSRIIANSNTRLKYPEHFNAEERIVELDGEAYFDIKQNTNKPFIVKTNSLSVEVTGTRFNIYAYRTSNMFEAALIEGAVQLIKENGAEKEIIPMSVGQIAKYDRKEDQIFIEKHQNENLLSWTSGYYTFKKAKLLDILDRLSQYYNKELVIENKEFENSEYTGTFSEHQSFEHALNVINAHKPIRYKVEGSKIIIY